MRVDRSAASPARPQESYASPRHTDRGPESFRLPCPAPALSTASRKPIREPASGHRTSSLQHWVCGGPVQLSAELGCSCECGCSGRPKGQSSPCGMARGVPLLLLLLGLLCPLPVALASGGMWQWPHLSYVQAGGSVSISCSCPTLLGLHLKQRWAVESNAVYYQDGQEPTVGTQFSGRVSFTGSMKNLTITLHRLQQADRGLYTCVAVTENKEFHGFGTLLMVTEVSMRQDTWLANHLLPVALAVGFFLLGLGLGAMCVLKRSQIKYVCGTKPSLRNIYEDMSYSRRCNTLSSPNQ
ncbi:T-cell antigen CD7 [Sorex fumeus]|uniref:T-cell antigen CD7 n=1 Tax=Sorex fumeus TaxID=62283 RepID=UPI0024AE3820|nr:T-cell antigen CD7 [Sorex fumeus]